MLQTPESISFAGSNDNTLSIDFYPAERDSIGCLIFFHGGALLIGSRHDLPVTVINYLRGLGWDVACGEYRLAPSHDIEQSVADVISTCREMRKRIQLKPIIISGYSAGGYLTLLAGALNAPVDGLLAFAGYGDLSADWCLSGSKFFQEYKNVDYCEEWLVQQKPFETVEEKIDLYIYLRQKAQWSSYVLGTNNNDKRRHDLSPINLISPRYPKTVLIHGSDDQDVPAIASEQMAEALSNNNVPHRLMILQGMDHDLFIQVENERVRHVWREALMFLSTHQINSSEFSPVNQL